MIESFDAADWLTADFKPIAAYFEDSDCVEYVNEDTVCVYERIDEFLTLIWDETKFRLIGFKLKGFRHLFETHLKAHLQLNQSDFILLVQAIEAVCQEVGDELLSSDQRRKDAYIAVRKLAVNERVELWDLPAAA